MPQIVARYDIFFNRNRIVAKKLCYFRAVFVTSRRLSFNIHPWPYVKFM